MCTDGQKGSPPDRISQRKDVCFPVPRHGGSNHCWLGEQCRKERSRENVWIVKSRMLLLGAGTRPSALCVLPEDMLLVGPDSDFLSIQRRSPRLQQSVRQQLDSEHFPMDSVTYARRSSGLSCAVPSMKGCGHDVPESLIPRYWQLY